MLRSSLLLLSLVLFACGSPDDSSTSDDTAGEDTDTDTDTDTDSDSDTGTSAIDLTFDAETPALPETQFRMFVASVTDSSTETAIPSGTEIAVSRGQIGVFHPSSAQLQTASPMSNGGNQTYYLKAQGAGTSQSAGSAVWTLTITDSMVESKGYNASWMWAARKDLGWGTFKSELVAGDAVVDTQTFNPSTVGFFYGSGTSYTAQAGDVGKALKLRFSHTTQINAEYQVLVDQVQLTSQ